MMSIQNNNSCRKKRRNKSSQRLYIWHSLVSRRCHPQRQSHGETLSVSRNPGIAQYEPPHSPASIPPRVSPPGRHERTPEGSKKSMMKDRRILHTNPSCSSPDSPALSPQSAKLRMIIVEAKACLFETRRCGNDISEGDRWLAWGSRRISGQG